MKIPLLAPGTYTLTQVMEKVIEVVAEEKKRLYMPKIIAFYNHEAIEGDDWGDLDATTLAECGTAACVCGWALVVTRRFNQTATDFFTLFNVSMHGTSRLEDDLYKLFFEWEEWKYEGAVRVPESFPEKQIRIADEKLVELRTLIDTHRAEMDTKTVTVSEEAQP